MPTVTRLCGLVAGKCSESTVASSVEALQGFRLDVRAQRYGESALH